MNNVKEKGIEIITGMYGKGTEEENQIVDSIFGATNTAEKFKQYFYWYNTIHELGHGVMAFNCNSRPHPIEEEQLVNDFAVAFWLHYGEIEKLNRLNAIVDSALSNFSRPAEGGTTHTEWAHKNWGTASMMTFNNYGWFQMSCVNQSFRAGRDLASVLIQMGAKEVKAQPQKVLVFPVINETTPSAVIGNAAKELGKWGVILPQIRHRFDNDPNKHMCNMIDL